MLVGMTSNPVLANAKRYKAERQGMNNPKDWAHVLRQVKKFAAANPWGATPDEIEQATRAIAELSDAERA